MFLNSGRFICAYKHRSLSKRSYFCLIQLSKQHLQTHNHCSALCCHLMFPEHFLYLPCFPSMSSPSDLIDFWRRMAKKSSTCGFYSYLARGEDILIFPSCWFPMGVPEYLSLAVIKLLRRPVFFWFCSNALILQQRTEVIVQNQRDSETSSRVQA